MLACWRGGGGDSASRPGLGGLGQAMGGSEKDSGVDLADGGGSAGGGGGAGARKKSVIRRLELSAPGGLGGCHRFRGVGVTSIFAWWGIFGVPVAFCGWFLGTHGLFVFVGAWLF